MEKKDLGPDRISLKCQFNMWPVSLDLLEALGK